MVRLQLRPIHLGLVRHRHDYLLVPALRRRRGLRGVVLVDRRYWRHVLGLVDFRGCLGLPDFRYAASTEWPQFWVIVVGRRLRGTRFMLTLILLPRCHVLHHQVPRAGEVCAGDCLDRRYVTYTLTRSSSGRGTASSAGRTAWTRTRTRILTISLCIGWLNLIGQICGSASSSYGAAQMLLAAVAIGSDFTYSPTQVGYQRALGDPVHCLGRNG